MALWSKLRYKKLSVRLTALALTALLVSALLFATFAAKSTDKAPEVLRIVCGSDAAGMIVAYAAEISGGAEIKEVMGQGVSFLRLADCCGTQAEFALAAGEFDMAVLCPDAAEEFLKSGKPFVIAGGILKNANVLVSKEETPPVNVGYTSGRSLQAESAENALGSGISLVPMATSALPYALEKGAVDAIVLDILNALKADTEHIITALPQDRASSVLVVSEHVIGTELYNSFLDAYNECIGSMDANTLAVIFETEEMIYNGKEKALTWQNMKTEFVPIPKNE